MAQKKIKTNAQQWLYAHASVAARGKFAASRRTGEFAGTSSIAQRCMQVKKQNDNYERNTFER